MKNGKHKEASGPRLSRSSPERTAISFNYGIQSNYRQYALLKISLIIIAFIGGMFSLVNFYRGLLFFAFVEVIVMLLGIILLCMLRRPAFFTFVRTAFVVMACAFGLIASAIPDTYPTIFAWNALVPVFAFYLLGKRWGVIITTAFLPSATILFLWYHMSGPNALPLFAFSNLIICIFSITLFVLYYENTRAETEEALIKDITERKRTEKALRESEKRYRTLFHDIADPVVIFREEEPNTILDCNKAMIEKYGYSREEVLKMVPPDFHPPDELERVLKNIRNKTPLPLEYIHIGKDGKKYFVEVHSREIRYKGEDAQLSIFRDFTERKHAEEEKKKIAAHINKIQNMETIATLAGGIAHRFNNALYAITGNIDLLEMDFTDDEHVINYTKKIKTSAHRMAQLAAQLLAYARGGKYQAKTVSLSEFVREALPAVKNTIDSAISVDIDLPLDIFTVKADLTQMQMVLSAVLANAAEAIEGEGHIRIVCKNKIITDEAVEDFTELKTGNYACLTVTDDGKGMDEDTRNRIFEPFSTTKFEGRGLGMAAAYGIVKNHAGGISVDSELGRGTTVKIYLPAIESRQTMQAGLPAGESIQADLPVVEPPVKEKAKPDLKPEWIKGTGTILVIEDEKPVMEVCRMILERLGYRVLEADAGKKAVEVVKTFDGPIDLAMLDILMPDMSGNKVYPLLKKIRPDLKVLVFSGYSIDGPARKLLDAGAEDFIQKPFTIAALSVKLKKILGNKSEE